MLRVLALGLFGGMLGASALANDTDLDALNLKPEPAREAKAAPARSTRLYIEGALGQATQRYGLGTESLRRLSLDLHHASRPAAGWRAVLSNRLDHVRPAAGDKEINSLREAYLGWQDDEGSVAVEAGRINLRTGPGYGYNPSDFFRSGSLRAATTIDPIALRDNRQGTVGLRVQRLWPGGRGLSLVLAPKLASGPSSRGMSLDLGSTNGAHQGAAMWSQELADGVSTQWVMYKRSGESPQLGANLSALLSDALVSHVEWSTGREPSLAARSGFGAALPLRRAHRGVAGLTLAAAAKLSLTAEFEYNGFALARREWAAMASSGGVAQLGRYLTTANQQQDLAARRALLLYLTKKDLGVGNLDLTALLRSNLDDHSRLVWLELRHRWGDADLALQWQRHLGEQLSEFGVIPARRMLQATATYRF